METFNIKHSSIVLFLVTFMAILIGSAVILKEFGAFNGGIELMVIILIILLMGYFCARYISTSEFQVIIDDNGIKRNWLKQFPFQNRPNLEISWDEISEYKTEPDKNWHTFKLISKKGDKLRILHNNDYDRKDDFEKFLKQFELRVNKINSDDITSNDIVRSPNIYEGKSGLIIAIVAGFAIISIIVLMVTSEHKINNPAALVSGCFGAMYFIFQVYLHRQKK